MKCDLCGFPATEDKEGWDRLRDHMNSTHSIEGWQNQKKYISEDEPACNVVLFC